MAIPAATQAGCAAKVRTLITYVMQSDWCGPAASLDWDKEMARALLGVFAGVSAEELAAVSNSNSRATFSGWSHDIASLGPRDQRGSAR